MQLQESVFKRTGFKSGFGLKSPARVRLNGHLDHSNYPLKRGGQFASQNCNFKCTLAELFDQIHS
jgi:hypothetical protein